MSKIKLSAYNRRTKSGVYGSIDPIIDAWVKKHRLNLLTMHQDYEVRSVEVGFMSKGARSFEINISPPDDQGIATIVIRNTNPPHNSDTLHSSKDKLSETLDKALKMAQGSSL